jgi:hypothetical protein
MPDIEYAFLADSAEVQPGSKFHVLGGGVTRLSGPAFPFTHPHLALVVGLRLSSAERAREHDLGFVVTAPDGAQVTNATGRVISRGPNDVGDIIVAIAIDLWNMTLRTAGEYSVRITIDGKEGKRLPLVVSATRESGGTEPTRYLA